MRVDGLENVDSGRREPLVVLANWVVFRQLVDQLIRFGHIVAMLRLRFGTRTRVDVRLGEVAQLRSLHAHTVKHALVVITLLVATPANKKNQSDDYFAYWYQ